VAEVRRDEHAETVRSRQEAAEEATAAAVVAEERVSRAREGLERAGTVRGRLRGLRGEMDGLRLERDRLEELAGTHAVNVEDSRAAFLEAEELGRTMDEFAELEGDRRRKVAVHDTEKLAGNGRLGRSRYAGWSWIAKMRRVATSSSSI